MLMLYIFLWRTVACNVSLLLRLIDYGLRDYGIDGQLGLEQTPDEYVANMVAVFREVKRVLREDGTCWVNLGDSYATHASKGSAQFGGDITDGRNDIFTKKKPTAQSIGLKEKDLIGIPWRVAFALQADGAADPKHMDTIMRMIAAITDSYEYRDEWPDKIAAEVERLEGEYIDAKRGGWWLRSDIIWAKPNPMPESVTDRCTKSHEYLFLLTKSPRYYFDQDAVRETSVYPEGSREDAPQGSFDGKHGDGAFRAIRNTRNIRSVWTIATQPTSYAHFATFPEKLVEPCIKAGTSQKGCCPKCGKPWVRDIERHANYGKRQDRSQPDGVMPQVDSSEWNPPTITDNGWRPGCDCDAGEPVPCVVFDPFMGSGTVERVAIRLRRKSVGTELNYQYIRDIASRRTADIQPTIF